MLHITKTFLALLSLSGAALGSVAQIKTDIATMSTTVTTLNTAIAKFPNTGGYLGEALIIRIHTEGLISAIKTTTGDVTATAAFSVDDGTAILDAIKAVAPNILSALTAIIAKKPAFAALPIADIPTLVYHDLVLLNGNATLLANGLITNSPDSLLADANAVKTNIGSAITVALTAYAAYA